MRGRGEMAEWSKAPDSKSGIRQRIGGSNPSLSATYVRKPLIQRRKLSNDASGPQKGHHLMDWDSAHHSGERVQDDRLQSQIECHGGLHCSLDLVAHVLRNSSLQATRVRGERV